MNTTDVWGETAEERATKADRYYRQVAMDQAIRSLPAAGTSRELVDAARAFYAFLINKETV